MSRKSCPVARHVLICIVIFAGAASCRPALIIIGELNPCVIGCDIPVATAVTFVSLTSTSVGTRFTNPVARSVIVVYVAPLSILISNAPVVLNATPDQSYKSKTCSLVCFALTLPFAEVLPTCLTITCL